MIVIEILAWMLCGAVVGIGAFVYAMRQFGLL